MVTFYVLLLAGQLIGIYDTPVKCERDKAAEMKRLASVAQWSTLECVKREID